MSPKNTQLGSILTAQNFIAPEKLAQALVEQQHSGKSLGDILLAHQYISQEKLAQCMAIQQNIPYIDLTNYPISPEKIRLLSEVQSRQYQTLVLTEQADAYLVGMVDPTNLRNQDHLAQILGRPILPSIITSQQFHDVIDECYRKSGQLDSCVEQVKREVDHHFLNHPQVNQSIDDTEAPVIKLLQTIFEEAVKMRASDIHLEPEEDKLVVRFRIDGELQQKIEADPKIASALIVRLKLLAGLNISEKRLPVDGRLTLNINNQHVDVRLSTIPTQFGESMVMRLLIQDKELLDLNKIGMDSELRDQFKKAIKSPHGIVLVTGPTGCGKTTTLYGALSCLNQRNVKILTCEDPVEYQIPGISQVQINEKIDLTFPRLLRAFLRQDPDIILLGEIRDLETAQIAMRAAMTGHLVLSTLHTNDAASAPVRLIDMGIPGYLIAATLRGVMSQRLLKLICTHCSEPYLPGEDELAWISATNTENLDNANFRHGRGCERCEGRGYHGRTGVFEFLEMTPQLLTALHQNDANNLDSLARASLGQHTLEYQAFRLALSGVTTLTEAMSLIGSIKS